MGRNRNHAEKAGNLRIFWLRFGSIPQKHPLQKVAVVGRCRICGGGRFSRAARRNWQSGTEGQKAEHGVSVRLKRKYAAAQLIECVSNAHYERSTSDSNRNAARACSTRCAEAAPSGGSRTRTLSSLRRPVSISTPAAGRLSSSCSSRMMRRRVASSRNAGLCETAAMFRWARRAR